jgi:aspartyl aminopeptidase
MIIPNLAIHMDRQVNDGHKFNAQVDMLPLFCEKGEEKDAFLGLIAAEADVPAGDILDTDLFLYNRMPAVSLGLNGEFIASGRLDDLQCAFASLKGFLESAPADSVAVHCVFDNEEVGSGTKQGAASTFLKDTLRRINSAAGRTEEEYLMSIASSFLVSADNAHAVHPNFAEKTDPTNRPYLNKGIVIKYSANQKYTTDAVSGAIMRAICQEADVPCQTFANRSDMLGGSTLGNIAQSQVALNTVDIGLPQLAMHSPYETAGAKDTAYLIAAAKVLFSSSVEGTGDGNYKLKF